MAGQHQMMPDDLHTLLCKAATLDHLVRLVCGVIGDEGLRRSMPTLCFFNHVSPSQQHLFTIRQFMSFECTIPLNYVSLLSCKRRILFAAVHFSSTHWSLFNLALKVDALYQTKEYNYTIQCTILYYIVQYYSISYHKIP